MNFKILLALKVNKFEISNEFKMSEEKKQTNYEDEPFYFDAKLLEPYNYLIRIPGKKIRTKLIQVLACFNLKVRKILNEILFLSRIVL
jgi:hypothetical protein